MNKVYYYKSPIGIIEIKGSDCHITHLNFTSRKVSQFKKPKELIYKKVFKQLKEYFSGKRVNFDLPLDLTGTPFQKKVWQKLLQIPFASTWTYKKVASSMGAPKAFRASASAIAKNPVSLLIPCHRVILSHGGLGGYAWGTHRKKWLIEHELKTS